MWWYFGYCNAFGKDQLRGEKGSVGLGGNISLSLDEFVRDQTIDFTKRGDTNTSGNGSIMRNAAIPIFYRENLDEALKYAAKQSQTTHQGIEAAECCRLLTYIVHKGIHSKKGDKSIIYDLSGFVPETPCDSIIELAQSKDSSNPNKNWNWKCESYIYSPERAKQQPGYVGSYAMDAMAMALHCVHSTNSFKEAMLKCANLRGDSDSVSAVAGQIAGALYGYKDMPDDWKIAVLQWDADKKFIPLRVYKLFYRRPINDKEENPTPSENHNDH